MKRQLAKPTALPLSCPLGWLCAMTCLGGFVPLPSQSQTVLAWGNDAYGQATVPANLGPVKALAAGENHSVVVLEHGAVTAWGDNTAGQTNVPPDLTNAVAISAGQRHSLALRADGSLVGWGANNYGQTQAPINDTGWLGVACGINHSLGWRADGSVHAWGSNSHGQTNVPMDLTHVTALAGGAYHSLALRVDSTVVAWGSDQYGQSTVPPNLDEVVAISAGLYHSLALRNDGTVVAWGQNNNGQCQVPTNLNQVVKIAAGGYHNLALRGDGSVVAWGQNANGQCEVPADLANGTALAAGMRHSLALVGDGSPFLGTHPVSQSVLGGSTVKLHVLVGGEPPLSIQWRRDGIAVVDNARIDGASTDTLTVADAQVIDCGIYQCAVTNDFGAVTSQVATLEVLPLVIVTQPQDQRVIPCTSVDLTVTAEGNGSSHYQWRKDGTDLADDGRIRGVNAATLTIAGMQESDVGSYVCLVSNGYGTVASEAAMLTLKIPFYVWSDSPSPAPPYDSWATAAHVIQDAVDAAAVGDTVLVTNGVYATGGRLVEGETLNRVVITKPLTVRSVGGPEVTAIEGAASPDDPIRPGPVRCVYIGTNAVLSGFILTNGHTLQSGYSETLGGGGAWCVATAVVTNCIVISNSALHGGGARGGKYFHCKISNNYAERNGGGVSEAALFDCTISSNRTWNYSETRGGGAHLSTLGNCRVIGNQSLQGGGVFACTASNCVIQGNYASRGGGAYAGNLYNCTLATNSAGLGGGGGVAGNSRLHNSIVYYNTVLYSGDGPNHSFDSFFYYSCVTPLPTNGTGNITNEPAFFDLAGGDLRLLPGSPCIDSGTNLSAFITNDLAGLPRPLDGNADGVAAFDMGAYEFDGPPPGGFVIYSHPESQKILAGSDVAFRLAAFGTGPFTYQWRKDGVGLANSGRISGATAAELSIGQAVMSDAGGYSAVVSNPSGALTSQVATLTVEPLRITSQPQSQRVRLGSNVTFSVVVEGVGPFGYQWQKEEMNLADGPRLSGATEATLSMTATTESDGGRYRVVVSNACGAVTSAVAILSSPQILYVWTNSPNPAPPYATWATAARTLQQAVDAAVDGDTVRATNGVYATGGRAVAGAMTNRVAIDRAITVESVNGPGQTLIVGYGPGGTNGDGAIRCAYLGSNAVLIGFTLTNGHTRTSGLEEIQQAGGGIWSEISARVTNCVLAGNSANWMGGGAYQGSLGNCVLAGNAANYWGGGSCGGTLSDCVLVGNSAGYQGGGSDGSTLYNCTLASNSVAHYGGGSSWGALYNCTLSGNSGAYGGGSAEGTLYNCTLTGNSARESGGGVLGGTLYNCTLTGNSAKQNGGGAFGGIYETYEAVTVSTLYNCVLTGNSAGSGGGAWGSTLSNCTLTGNRATSNGGGAHGGPREPCALYNCIAYHNSAPTNANYLDCTFQFSCTTPLPPGEGNIDADPRLASTSHLSLDSPCIAAGSSTYSSGVDIDGEPWASPPCMGADQLTPGNATGPLTVAIRASYTRFAVDFAAAFVADIVGPVTASVWDFGDGTAVTNQAFISHRWANAGTYVVRLIGYNDGYPGGVSVTLVVEVVPEVYCVSASNPTPVFPYTNWATAARNIQDAIGAAGKRQGRLVLVTNGIYGAGTYSVPAVEGFSRVVLTNPVIVRSVNGPEVTVIQGGTVRCAYVAGGAMLSGFTLTNGSAGRGGGLWGESSSALVTNCILIRNSASGPGGGGAYGGTLSHCTFTGNSTTGPTNTGGGAWRSTLDHCTLSGNSAGDRGGGAHESTLDHCALIGNWAWTGAGASASTLWNCLLTVNAADFSGGGASGGLLYHCTLSGNSAPEGGGASGSTLFNCTLADNGADNGGGAYGGALYHCALSGNWASDQGGGVNGATLVNSIVYHNTAPTGPNHHQATFRHSCSTPLPDGLGNIAVDPGFMNPVAGNFRLRLTSPCIDAGTNLSAVLTTDLDGLPRPLDGNGDGAAAFDMGAHEFLLPTADSNVDSIPDGWTHQHGLNPTAPNVAAGNPDGDAHTTFEEWQADTDPTNAHSCFRITSIAQGPPVTVQFLSSSNRVYSLQRAASAVGAVWTEVPGQTAVPGSGGLHTLSDANPAPATFYRVGVRARE